MNFNKSQLTAIITIYRNDKEDTRRHQRNKFLEGIKKYGNFDVYLIEQSKDGNKFNIGKLKNIGFEMANKSGKKYDFYIFTDIDILPDEILSKYYFNVINGIACLGIRGTRYAFGNCFTGTCIGFDKNSFIKINGYPNNFWGWGGEDNCILLRCNLNDINIFTPKNGRIIDLERDKTDNKVSINKKLLLLNKDNLKEKLKVEKIILDRKIWMNNGINNLNYKVLDSTNEKKIEFELFHYIVDLEYKFDKLNYGDWYNLSKYEKLTLDQIKILYKKVKKKYFWCKFKYY